MARRSTERGTERSTEREAEQSSSTVPAQSGGDTSMTQRQGGAIASGPFSLIDWMLDRLQRDFFGSSSTGAGGTQVLSQGGGGTTRSVPFERIASATASAPSRLLI